MDRGAWKATVHGVARLGHNLATKPPPPSLENEMATLSSILAGKFHGWGAWQATVHGITKSRTRLSTHTRWQKEHTYIFIGTKGIILKAFGICLECGWSRQLVWDCPERGSLSQKEHQNVKEVRWPSLCSTLTGKMQD